MAEVTGPHSVTSSTNYVACGNGTGPDGISARATLVYTLAGSSNGYDIAAQCPSLGTIVQEPEVCPCSSC